MKWITREKIKVDRVVARGSSRNSSTQARNFSSCRETLIGQKNGRTAGRFSI
jgi:hypothetical protein